MHAADLRTAEGIQKGAVSAEEAHMGTAPMPSKPVVRLMGVCCNLFDCGSEGFFQ